MSTEAQKVIPRSVKTSGAQEMSIARLETVVDGILRLLEDLPPAYRLHALRMVEEKVRPSILTEDVRRVTKMGRASYAITVPRSVPQKEYKIRVEGNKLIYEPVEGRGDARVRRYGHSSPRLSIPKWAWEAIGSPEYVRLRIEESRIIIIEPA